MPLTALVLAEPTPVQEMPVPQTYAEARQVLYLAGQSLVDLIAAQPAQKTNTQVTTAEIVRGIGDGLVLLIPNTAETAGQPEPGDIQFSLNVGGELQVAFDHSPYAPSSDVCLAINEWLHAGYWWLARERISPSMSKDGMTDAFLFSRRKWVSSSNDDEIKETMQNSMTTIVNELFDLAGGGELFETLRIGWRGADACFGYAREELRRAR